MPVDPNNYGELKGSLLIAQKEKSTTYIKDAFRKR